MSSEIGFVVDNDFETDELIENECYDITAMAEVEVIGNKYEDPELLVNPDGSPF